MAVTKIWTIKDSLQRVLDYAANPDKTEYDALAQTLHYAENDAKTKLNESAQLVTGIHCRADHAWEDMRAVQERFGKTDGVVALHAYQSFREGEVTPEQCHEIGVALARKVWGKRFQVLVATHVPHPDTFTRHLRKLYKQCGLSEDYHLHTLRHFYATYLLQEGTSKQVAASLLGHADTAFLERTYCHPQDVAKRQAANLMQDLLNNQNPCYVAFMKNKNRKAKKAG